jgi:hypothetical protein
VGQEAIAGHLTKSDEILQYSKILKSKLVGCIQKLVANVIV